MSKVQIVLVEWMGYPLFRNKELGANKIQCGLGRLLENMQRYEAGADFECTVIFNEYQSTQSNPLVNVLDKVSAFKPYLVNQVQTNSKEKYDSLLAQYPFVKQSFYRENNGQDIGAYDFFHEHLKGINHDGDVLFVNSSTRGPSENGWLAKYRELFLREADTGLCGISLNSHDTSIESGPFKPHIQSFFLYTNMKVLADVFPNGFLAGEEDLDKGNLIAKGELGISTKILAAGYGLRCSAFPEFYYKPGVEWTIPEGDIRFQPEFYHLANEC